MPPEWARPGRHPVTQAIGGRWIDHERSTVLQVPSAVSAVVRGETNLDFPVRSETGAIARLCHTGGVRFFNTTGPVRRERHYAVPPLSRLDLDEVLGLIRTARYFVLHAPRQTGKTSILLACRTC